MVNHIASAQHIQTFQGNGVASLSHTALTAKGDFKELSLTNMDLLGGSFWKKKEMPGW